MEIYSETLSSEYAKEKNGHRPVIETIFKLPLRQREAVMLRYHDGLEVSEVALAMGVPLQSAATYLSLARKRLAIELDKSPMSRLDANLEPIPMGIIISEALRFDAMEFLPTEAEWIQDALEECHRYIFAKLPEAAPAQEAVLTTIAAARAPFGAIVGALTTFLIAGALALGITLGGVPMPQQEEPPAAAAQSGEDGLPAPSESGADAAPGLPAADPADIQGYDAIVEEAATPLAPWDIGKREEDVPMVELGDKGVLLFSPTGTMSWALLNLILCAIGFLYAVLSVERIFLKRKRERKENREGSASGSLEGFGDMVDLDEDQVSWDFRPSWLVTSVAMAIVGGIMFLLTQDTRNPMVLVDWWTSIHAVIFTVQLTGVILIIKDDKPRGEKAADSR